MKITREQFEQELRKIVASPAWAELPGWFTETLVRRVIRSSQPLHGHSAEQAQRDQAGAAALMLAIENAISGDGHGDSGDPIKQRIERLAASSAGGAYSRQRQRADAAGSETDRERGAGGTG